MLVMFYNICGYRAALADKIGVSFASINRWENGKTTPSKLARKQLNSLREQINNEKLKRVVLK